MNIWEARQGIGRKVIYRPFFRREQCEEGVITSVNDTYVFVRYGADGGSKATLPDELSFISIGEQE